MAEFEQLRDELAGSRRELEHERARSALLAREAVRQAERALAEFARPGDRGSEAERARAREAALEGARERGRRRLSDGSPALRAAEARRCWRQFADVHRPARAAAPAGRTAIRSCCSRCGSRRASRRAPSGQPQLWVRVYPDTCLVDTFEASLTEQEVANAQRVLGRGVARGRRRGAGARGLARAGRLARLRARRLDRPPVPAAQPERQAGAGQRRRDVLLIIVGAGTAARRGRDLLGSGVEGGRRRRRAAGGIRGARSGGRARRRRARSRSDYRPVQLRRRARRRRARAPTCGSKVAVLQLTPPENLETRRTSWSSAPRVDLLPERFVLVAYAARRGRR